MRPSVFAACLLSVSALAAEPPMLIWAGSGGDPATAGGGRWDLNDSVVWRDGGPAGDLVKWTDRRLAIFTGSAGGAIALADPITVEGLRFGAGAGAFTFSSTGPTVVVNGEGIACESPRAQTFQMHQAILTFAGKAAVGTGSFGSQIRITSDAITEFVDDTSAGRATLASTGELRFSARSSAADATISNGSLLIFEGEARCGAAAIDNHGLLNIQDHASDFSAAATSNGDGGVIDVASVAPPDGVRFASLTNGPGSVLILGRQKLTIRRLILVGECDFNFDIAAGATGHLTVTGMLFGNPTKPRVRITITDAGGLDAGSSYPLIDWRGAAWVDGVDLADFALQPLPGDLPGRLEIRDSQLVLVVKKPAGKRR